MPTINRIQLNRYFPEVQECSHSRTHSAKEFVPSFDDKLWTSVLYIERGNFTIRYETGEVLKAKGGTFYYHPPRSLKYQTEDKTITPYSMYHLAVDLSFSKPSLFSSNTAEQDILQQIPEKPFVRKAPPLMVSSFKTILHEYAEQHSGFLIQMENSIRQIVISAIRSGIEDCPIEASNRVNFKKVDAFLLEHIEFMGPVELLFDQMGVSRSRGYALFHQTFGITPKEYILRKKIILAKQMLLEGHDITTIAFELGFASSQSFATTFKKLTCYTPSNFRRDHTS